MRANKGIISKLSSLLILRIYNNHNSPRDNKTIIHKIKCLNYTHKLKYRSKESKEFFFYKVGHSKCASTGYWNKSHKNIHVSRADKNLSNAISQEFSQIRRKKKIYTYIYIPDSSWHPHGLGIPARRALTRNNSQDYSRFAISNLELIV